MEQSLKYRVVKALIALLVAMTIGTVGFWLIEGGNVPLGDCLYMTIITLSTVGYGEVIPLTDGGRVFTSLLIIFGMGSLLYFGSTVIAFWVEIDMSQARRRRKMQKAIDNLNDHIIVCGIGTTGSHVVRELLSAKMPFVMVETDEDRVAEIRAIVEEAGETPLLLTGDATDDRVLQEAGIERAGGLVAALRSDKDNLYIILSARQTNPGMRIIARATEKGAPEKMRRAGANRVVSPNLIGGMRIASEMIRPQVVEFLDMMLRDMDQSTRIEQVNLPLGSPLVGKRLLDTNIRKSTDVLVIAIREKNGKYLYNPGPNTALTEQATLIVLGTINSVIRLRESITGRNGDVSLINT